MGETLFIYISLLLFGVSSSFLYKLKTNSVRYIFLLISFLLMSFIIGGRYEVGTDWVNYVYIYETVNFVDLSIDGLNKAMIEPMYLLINKAFRNLGVSTSMFFTIIAFSLFVLLYTSTGKKKVFPYVMYFFFTMSFFLSLNIMRQILAIFIFFFATRYIGKNIYKYFTCILIAFFIHYSSVILFPLYFIYKKWFSILDNKKIIVICYFITLLMSGVLVELITSYLPQFISNEKYLNSVTQLDVEMEVGSGLGIIFNHIINMFIILYYPNSNKLGDRRIIIYRLFIIGILFSNVFSISMYLSRVVLSLVLLKIFLLADICNIHVKKKRVFSYLFTVFICIILFITFIMGIINNNSGIFPYQFRWL